MLLLVLSKQVEFVCLSDMALGWGHCCQSYILATSLASGKAEKAALAVTSFDSPISPQTDPNSVFHPVLPGLRVSLLGSRRSRDFPGWRGDLSASQSERG